MYLWGLPICFQNQGVTDKTYKKTYRYCWIKSDSCITDKALEVEKMYLKTVSENMNFLVFFKYETKVRSLAHAKQVLFVCCTVVCNVLLFVLLHQCYPKRQYNDFRQTPYFFFKYLLDISFIFLLFILNMSCRKCISYMSLKTPLWNNPWQTFINHRVFL